METPEGTPPPPLVSLLTWKNNIKTNLDYQLLETDSG